MAGEAPLGALDRTLGVGVSLGLYVMGSYHLLPTARPKISGECHAPKTAVVYLRRWAVGRRRVVGGNAVSTAYPDRIAALRTWAEMSPDAWARDYSAAFIETYNRNRDLGWGEAQSWQRAELSVTHYRRPQ